MEKLEDDVGVCRIEKQHTSYFGYTLLTQAIATCLKLSALSPIGGRSRKYAPFNMVERLVAN